MRFDTNRSNSFDATALARFFTSSVIRELARRGESSLAKRLAQEITPGFAGIHEHRTLGDFLESVYEILSKTNFRHEYVYKNAIAKKILLGRHSLNTACMMTEFRVGSCKADVVILNGTSTVYEIKSERDSLSRLENQVSAYRLVFDEIYVIAGHNHVCALERSLPSDVGILVLTKRQNIHTVREARGSTSDIVPDQIFESLQRREYLSILDRFGVDVPDLPNTQIHSAAKKLFGALSPEQAHRGMVEVLRQSRSPVSNHDFIRTVPDCLKAAAISIPLSKSDRCRFLKVLCHDIDTTLALA